MAGPHRRGQARQHQRKHTRNDEPHEPSHASPPLVMDGAEQRDPRTPFGPYERSGLGASPPPGAAATTGGRAPWAALCPVATPILRPMSTGLSRLSGVSGAGPGSRAMQEWSHAGAVSTRRRLPDVSGFNPLSDNFDTGDPVDATRVVLRLARPGIGPGLLGGGSGTRRPARQPAHARRGPTDRAPFARGAPTARPAWSVRYGVTAMSVTGTPNLPIGPSRLALPEARST